MRFRAAFQNIDFATFQFFCSIFTHSFHDLFSSNNSETHIKPYFNQCSIIPKGFISKNSKSSYQTQISQFGQNKVIFSF